MKINIVSLISDADIVVKFVILLLMVFSIISWDIILKKYFSLKKANHNSVKFMEFFASQSSLAKAFDKAKKVKHNPVAEMFIAAYLEIKKEKTETSIIKDLTKVDQIERVLEVTKQKELSKLESRISFLATAGSAAPFIGLFGTVWGIMNSFLNIGSMGSTNLAVVAPGIAEALIATAIGLFAAIPAVMGYNYCVNQIKKIVREMDNFSNDFLNSIRS
ncbi:MAG: protein TolQ [Bdellovibrionota bacterium]